MLRTRQILSADRGSALMTGIIVMMMVSMFGLAYVTFTTANLARANRDERRATAFYLAEAGIEWAIPKVVQAVEANGGTVPNITYTGQVSTLMNSLRSGATGSVSITAEAGGIARLVSTATYRNVTQSVRVRMKFKNVGIWNNAIFGGVGASGRTINGNVDIHGSVHILGDGEPFSDLNGNGIRDGAESYTDSNGNGQYDSGEPFTDADSNGVWTAAEPYTDKDGDGSYDPPLTAADIVAVLSGTADVGNNYSGIPVELSTRIPSLGTQTFGGESVQTLNAELRVKHGKFGLSGSATAGQPNVAGNSIKETLDGAYVSDGFGGNAGASAVNSDNGTSNPYDLGDRLKFPSLQDPYTDKTTGLSYATYEAYLDSKSMLFSVNNISSSTPSFSQSDGNGNSISWNQGTSTLTINGIVRIASDLNLSSKGSTIYFAGKGTMFSKGSVNVHGSVLPKTMFPTTDCMGVIAKQDINFATGSGEAQLSGAGAWYAEKTIRSAKQNKFAGTYVADYFDMGSNVPSIYQVPALAQNLPPGMPGSESVFASQTLSWRHL